MGPDDAPYCLAYVPNCIAVSVPSGVKIWLYTEGMFHPKMQKNVVDSISFTLQANGSHSATLSEAASLLSNLFTTARG
jgi:hypothetical protein